MCAQHTGGRVQWRKWRCSRLHSSV